MTTVVVSLLVAAIVLLLAWAYFTAQRLHRLYIRTDAARQSLEAALNRRAAVITALAEASHHDTSGRAEAAEAIALSNENLWQRASAERQLDTVSQPLVSHPRVVDATTRVELATRFYNEAVSDTRALAQSKMVRMARLGGNAKIPEYFEYSPR